MAALEEVNRSSNMAISSDRAGLPGTGTSQRSVAVTGSKTAYGRQRAQHAPTLIRENGMQR